MHCLLQQWHQVNGCTVNVHSSCTIQSLTMKDGRRHKRDHCVQKQFVQPVPSAKTSFSFSCSIFYVLVHLSPQWLSLESFLCLLLSKPSHLPNDENSGENTSQENTNRLPCWCAKVGTYAFLKTMDNRHKIFSMAYANKQQKELTNK